MKPQFLATAEPAMPPARRVLRYAPAERAAAVTPDAAIGARALAALLVAIAPLLAGRAVAVALDEPMLGLVAGALSFIPLMTALCPRAGGRPI